MEGKINEAKNLIKEIANMLKELDYSFYCKSENMLGENKCKEQCDHCKTIQNQS